MKNLAMVCALAAAAGVAGCSKRENKAATDLPPAQDWNEQAAGEAPSGAADNPHAGMGMEGPANPHAGVDMGGQGGDPHAGLGMAGAGDPHAGLDMGGPGAAMDPAMAAMQPPDPSRAIDPSKVLVGAIVTTEATKPLVKPGDIIYLAVRPIDPATREIIGSPIAVERVDVAAGPIEFTLSDANAMSAGTEFAGDVVINARVDRDGEARTKEPGDIEGSIHAKIPAKGLVIKLDTVLR